MQNTTGDCFVAFVGKSEDGAERKERKREGHRRKSLYQGCPKNVHIMLYLPLISIEVHKYNGPQAIYGKWPGRAYLYQNNTST